VALFVGAGLGWLLDRGCTGPIFIVVMFILGAAAASAA
jgi:F0F1-type ATP synthase assembly protein I